MHMTDLIEKKKQGQTLTQEELHFIVHGYTAGDIPDYQMSALMMAIYFRGMTPEETAQLTIEMEHSGDVVDLSPLGPLLTALGGGKAAADTFGHDFLERPFFWRNDT